MYCTAVWVLPTPHLLTHTYAGLHSCLLDIIDSQLVLYCEIQHVKGGVPPCSHIMKHIVCFQAHGVKGPEPQGQENGCRVENCECNLAEL
jgi:hypothetical protein